MATLPPPPPWRAKCRSIERCADYRRLGDEGNPSRAADLEELLSMQMTQKTRDEFAEHSKAASISDSLKSLMRGQGPRIATRQPRHIYIPRSPPTSPAFKRQPGGGRPQNGDAQVLSVMSDSGLRPTIVFHNACVAELYEHALRYEPGSRLTASGALAVPPGGSAGQTPGVLSVVREPSTQAGVWWGPGSPNIPMDSREFLINRERAVDYLNTQPRLYIVDGFAGWSEVRLKVRVVCARPHHALSARSMLVVPSAAELDGFGRPDLTLYNAGAFPANRRASHNASAASIALDLTRRELVVLGTLCPGDMRRGLQAALSHALPAAGAPCFHAACDEGGAGDAALLLGSEGRAALAGRGERRLLADGLVAWGEDGVCALEGGCHTVAGAWSGAGDGPGDGFGVLLVGAAVESGGRVPGLASPSTTPRVRATYPTTLVPRNRMPCAARHPANLIMLCCDTLGVLPPVARLTADQAVYYFLSGYSAKFTEEEGDAVPPEPAFSPCYCSDFLVWHPGKYAAMLAPALRRHGMQAWLVNTGWTGGGAGAGARHDPRHIQAVVHAILSDALRGADLVKLPVLGLEMPRCVPGVPAPLMDPRGCWPNGEAYDDGIRRLAGLFAQNWEKLGDGGGHFLQDELERIRAAGPQVDSS
ncbi:hypothetical protein ACKKBG_A05155 [Auxenochlorella protothecoides x Auxenochlorella symbiontica]